MIHYNTTLWHLYDVKKSVLESYGKFHAHMLLFIYNIGDITQIRHHIDQKDSENVYWVGSIRVGLLA